MIRSSIYVRRIAASVSPKHAAPISSATTSPIVVNSSVTVPIVAPCFHSAVMASCMASRSFSSSSVQNLSDIISREIDEEEEAAADQNGQLPPELAELHREISQNWTILEGISGIGSGTGPIGSGASVRMFKKQPGSNGAKIGVVFHCQDTEEAGQDYEQYEDQNDEEPEPAQAVRFGVTVSKGGKTLVIQCRAEQGEIDVESVAVRDGDTESVLAALAGGEEMDASLYQGPEFGELAEDLQGSFVNFVENECGVDTDVAAFISMYADYREQEEYVAWLKAAKRILA